MKWFINSTTRIIYKKGLSCVRHRTHPLANLLETISALIEVYEQEHHPVAGASVDEVLRFLMQEHHLEPNELPEIGRKCWMCLMENWH